MTTLQEKFLAYVMCDFTPRHPRELPIVKWASFNRLLQLFQPHAPMEVWLLGPSNLKQLITHWYKRHPAFLGLKQDAWVKRLVSKGPLATRFCFEYTPRMGRHQQWTQHQEIQQPQQPQPQPPPLASTPSPPPPLC